MKTSFFSTICLVSIITCSCTTQQNDVTLQEAIGHVKSIRTTAYEPVDKFGEISEGDILAFDGINNLIVFNEQGYIKEISYYDKSGDLDSKKIYLYDSDGKISRISNYDDEGEETGRTVFTYNENRQVIKVTDYDETGEINYTQEQEWDGKTCVKYQFISEDSDGDYTLFEHKGQTLIRSEVYDKSGRKTGRYSEFEKGKLTKCVFPEYTTSISYNEKGLCSSIENGQCYAPGTYTISEGESYTYEYEYDKKGNWIRKVEWEQPMLRPVIIFKREIEYF